MAAKLPDIEPFDPTSLADGALYICALGFEPRCLSIGNALAAAGRRFNQCVVLEYETNRAENELNRAPLMQALSKLSDSIRCIDVDEMDFVDTIRDELRVVVAGVVSAPIVVLDISVLANRALFRCLKALLESDIDLVILYSEADIYHPTKEVYDKHAEQWAADSLLGLEQGVSDIRVSRDFPGQQLELLPDCVVVFPSFNGSRTNAVLAKIDPALVTNAASNVIWFVGVPHMESDHWRIAAMKEINKIDSARISYEVSTFSYKDGLQMLHNVYNERSADHNITLSPLGSKLQALGCVLFCLQRPDVRVIYSVPARYNAQRYSDGHKALWQIKFGSVSGLRRLLGTIGKLRMEEVEGGVPS